MGVIVKITCGACKSEWQCRKGCGMQHGQLENVKMLFPPEIKDRLESYAAETKFPFFDFGYQPAVCGECRAITDIPVMKLPEQQKTYTGVCEGCGQPPGVIEKLEETRCPVCGECSLTEEETGMWD